MIPLNYNKKSDLDFCSLDVPFVNNNGPVEMTPEPFLSQQITTFFSRMLLYEYIYVYYIWLNF